MKHSEKNNSKKTWLKWVIIAVAVCVCAAVVLILIFSGRRSSGSNLSSGKIKHIQAAIPDEHYGGPSITFLTGDSQRKWRAAKNQFWEDSSELQSQLADFYSATIRQILESDDANVVYSPLNLYIALSVLAETANGQTQEQILELLGMSDVDELRGAVNALWNANYSDTPVLQSQLGNSLWLRSDTAYNQELLNTLASRYYADIITGEMGSSAMDKALKKWTDEHTGGKLSEYTSNMSTSPEVVMDIVSTIYFKNTWSTKFDSGLNTTEIFHGLHGDTEVQMMHKRSSGMYYYGENYSAISLGLDEMYQMYFVLPDDGFTIGDVLENDQLYDLLQHGREDDYADSKYMIINASVPKFSLHSKLKLVETLKQLGVTDAFDESKADFYRLLDNPENPQFPIWVNGVEHAAMVEIDEEGVTGAAYTELMMAGSAAPPKDEIDFVLDRPFLYFVMGRDDSVLFAGTALDIK